MDSLNSLRYLNKFLYQYRSYLLWGTVFTIISNVFSIAPAPIVRYAFDLIEEAVDLHYLYKGYQNHDNIYALFAQITLFYGALIVAMALLRGVFLFMVRQTIIVMSRLIEYDLKNTIYAQYQNLPLSFYRRNNTGDLMARISEDVGQVRMYLGPAIMYSINLVTLSVMIIAFMFMIDTTLAFYTILPLPFLSISIYYVSNWINKQSTELQKQLSGLSTYTQEAFSGVRVVKAFSREDDSIRRFAETSEKYRKHAIRLSYIEALFYPLIILLVGLSSTLIIYIGGIEVMKGKITNGVIAEFVIYSNMLVWPVTAIGWVMSLAQRAAASQTRINEFLEVKNEIVSTKNTEREIVGKIAFHDVALTYPDTGVQALQNISFEVQAGETLAILGTTGSGKSTIANLIPRMYDVTAGKILIDDIPIEEYAIGSLRSQISVVPQDVFLFSESIRNNIKFGLEDCTEEQLIQAVKDADLYHNVMDFPEKLETLIGERGITLSGGQKQRASIARAIIRNPKILILDDSLSAVDTKTEHAILNNLERIMHNRTSIIISHRVSSVKLANKILVLDEGHLVEQGTHESLMQNNGLYKELYEKQLQTEGEEVG
ncbi:MAG: ABC transporter ATP-binding protein [Bacteroidetes bacterium]|nr:MAG: ABC transporter ATP-binding protein [Bacteroidota bacterium]